MTTTTNDILIIGAGIIGAACAYELANAGLSVRVIDARFGGATNAGMGHLVVMDDTPAELAISGQSMHIWQDWAARMLHSRPDFQYRQCGTMWIASNAEEMAEAERKYALLQAYGMPCALLNSTELAQSEPALRAGLYGALEVKSDGLIYAPDAAEWLLMHAVKPITVEDGIVVKIDDQGVVLQDGSRRNAGAVVLASGVQTPQLCPDIPVMPKKGHLAITDRYPHYIHHQLVELGYITRAHHSEGTSVAFNAQPRPTGQIFLGSSRQFDSTDKKVDLPVLSMMLQSVVDFLPGMKEMNIIRTWTGLRPASPDGQPLIGKHPWHDNVWMAVGHEGLGVTTAPATAKLLSALILQQTPDINPAPYSPERLMLEVPA